MNSKETDGFQAELAALRARVAELEHLEKKHRTAGETLQESEDTFRALFNGAHDAIFIHDFTGKFIEVNHAACERLGYERNELLSMTPFDIDAPPHAPHVKKRIEQIEQKGHLFFETAHITKGGREIPIELSSSIIEFRGKPAVLSIARDITDRKDTERLLHESKEKYHNLFHHSNDAIFVHDLDGNIIDVNKRALDFFGYDEPEVFSLSISGLHPAYAREKSKWAFEKISRDGHANFEIDFTRKNGEIFPAEVSSNMLEIGGHPVIQKVIRDITERKNEEHRIRESEEKFRTLAEKLPNMVFINKNGRVVYANERCSDLTGYTREEFYSPDFDFRSLIARDSLTMIEANFKKHLLGKEVNPIEYGIITKGGVRKDVYITTKLITYESEQAILGIITDLTERKDLERRLGQSQKMEAIGQLAGGIAHDFNNLLIGIMGYSDLILSQLGTDDPLRNDALEIRKAADRAASLTRKLLVFGSREMLQRKTVDLGDILGGLHRMLERLIGEDIELTAELDPELKTVNADPAQLEVSFINLVANARDAMPEGGKLKIKIENTPMDEAACNTIIGAEPGDYVRVTVQDTGVGIAPDVIDRIFEPFYTTKKEMNGTGMGLATVYGCIKQHGGCINVNSTPGRGSTFEIYLPATAENLQEEENSDVSLTELRGNGECILLVEDEGRVRNFASRVLRENGYRVFEARNAEEGMEILQRERDNIDILFSDVVLPGKSGIRLVEKIKSIMPDLKVIMSSGYTGQKSHWDVIREHEYRFIMKPYSVMSLLSAIKETLATG